MQTSKFKVENRKIEELEVVPIIGNVHVDTFSFEFDAEWDGFTKMLALCIDGDWYEDILDDNDEVEVRKEAYDAIEVTFGIYGIKGEETLSTSISWLHTKSSTFGKIGDVKNLPDKETWNLYTREMLALVAEGKLTLRECNNILDNIQEYKTETEQFKNDAQAIRDDVFNMARAFIYPTFEVDPVIGHLYLNSTDNLENMGFSISDNGHLVLEM